MLRRCYATATPLLRHSSVGVASPLQERSPRKAELQWPLLEYTLFPYKKKDVKKSKSLLVISKDIIYRKVD